MIRRLDGRLQGSYRTHFYGSGIDFADLRTYTPEDDVRHIDWNVTARLDEPYVRQYTEDRELTAWLLLDRSRSMAFGPRGARQGRRARPSSPSRWPASSCAAATASAPCSTTSASSGWCRRARAATTSCASATS